MKRFILLSLAAMLPAVPSLTRAAEPAAPAADTAAVSALSDAELADQLAAAIDEIQATVTDPAERKERMALLIAEAVKAHGTRAAGILAALTGRVNELHLPVLSAAAVMASGSQSPQVLQAMVAARTGNEQSVAAVRQGASNPVAVLGTTVAAQVQPTVNAGANPQVAAAAAASGGPEITGGGTPPQPPEVPPRPPAIPYRGQ